MSRLKYLTGEALEPGDSVDYLGESSVIELVVNEESPDNASRWLAENAGSGCLLQNKSFGRVFVPLDAFDKLVFRGRHVG